MKTTKAIEEDFVKAAKKYVPDLTEEQEDLVRRIAQCPNCNGVNVRAELLGKPHLYKMCFCILDLLGSLSESKRSLDNTK